MDKVQQFLKRYTGVYKSKAWHLYDNTADSENINVFYVGTEAHKNTILHAFFPQDGKQRYLGEQYFWGVKCLSPKKINYDLAVIECDAVDQMPDKHRTGWFVPRWIKTYTDIPVAKPNNSYKYNLRVITKHKFDYWVTTDDSLIKKFYDEMYVPFINKRHQDRSLPMQLEDLQNAVANGNCELLLVRDEVRNIAGMVIDYRKMPPNLWSVAVLNADDELLSKSAVFACYHFSFIYLLEKGYSRVSLGFSRAFLNDGVLQFKRKFGFKILFPTIKGFAVYPLRHSDALSELLTNQPFVHINNQQMHLASFVSDEENIKKTMSSTLKRNKGSGLASSQVFHASKNSIKLELSQPFENSMTQLITASDLTNDSRNIQNIADFFVHQLMNMRPGEHMLLYSDEESDKNTIDVILQATESKNIKVHVHELSTEQTKEQHVEQLIQLLENNQFHALCEMSGQYFYNTPVWRKAHQKDTYTYGLGALSLDAFLRCVGQVDNQAMYELGQKVEARLRKASIVRITQEDGTDIQIGMKMSRAYNLLAKSKLLKAYSSRIFKPSGYLFKGPKKSTFLGGQVAFLGVMPRINGTLVINQFMWPPKNIGPLKHPITLTIRNGRITKIEGSSEAEILKNWLPETERHLMHVCIGMNPGAQMTQGLIEAERVFGACNFGFGSDPYHTDGVISKTTLTVDGETLIDKGQFVSQI